MICVFVEIFAVFIGGFVIDFFARVIAVCICAARASSACCAVAAVAGACVATRACTWHTVFQTRGLFLQRRKRTTVIFGAARVYIFVTGRFCTLRITGIIASFFVFEFFAIFIFIVFVVFIFRIVAALRRARITRSVAIFAAVFIVIFRTVFVEGVLSVFCHVGVLRAVEIKRVGHF